MSNVDVSNVRNFIVVGHPGTGKTTLCDLMLYKGKAVDRLGATDKKSSVSDFTIEEQERLSSIYATPLHCNWGNSHFSFIDAPGYGEFVGEFSAAFMGADNVIIVIDAANGIAGGTIRAWKLARKLKKPTFIAVNRIDRENGGFLKIIRQLEETYGQNLCVPVTLANAGGPNFSTVFDLIYDAPDIDEMKDDIAHFKEELMDDIAETDEAILDHYLSGEPLDAHEVDDGLHHAIINGTLVPVFAISAAKDIGVTELMNAIETLFIPPTGGKPMIFEDGHELPAQSEGDVIVQAFKQSIDATAGIITYLKVRSGILKQDCEIWNLNTNTKERIGQIFEVNGKVNKTISEAYPGMIVAVSKMKTVQTGHTLCSTNTPSNKLPIVPFPSPVMSLAISPTKPGEEEKIASGLHKFIACDGSYSLRRHPETHEELLSGMGDQHLALILKRLKDSAKLEVKTAQPKIPYREAILANGEGHHRHKKQSGGHGQFAEVYLRISPNQEGYQFSNDIVGGTIPRNFIPAVEKGILEAMERGPLAGCVVERVKVSVYDGKFHDVDSSEMAFKIAGRAAFRDAMSKAQPILLEPIMAVKIMIPDHFMGAITGDLNQRRGRVAGMLAEDGLQVVTADVPLAEMARYAAELRSMSQGQGAFEMTFARYERVPEQIAKAIIEKFKAQNSTEEE